MVNNLPLFLFMNRNNPGAIIAEFENDPEGYTELLEENRGLIASFEGKYPQTFEELRDNGVPI